MDKNANTKECIVELILHKKITLNKLCEYIYVLDDYELIDIYYELKNYSLNMAIEFALNIIVMVGKRDDKGMYFEETFFENLEIELDKNGNHETIKMLERYVEKENNSMVKKLFEQYLGIIK